MSSITKTSKLIIKSVITTFEIAFFLNGTKKASQDNEEGHIKEEEW